MEKIKFKRYDVQWKNHKYCILIPHNTDHLLTYEDGDRYRGWIGDRKAIKNLMYAAAILGFNPTGKMIYFPIRKNAVPEEYSWADPCDLLFTTHQVQLKRSEWNEIRKSLKYVKEKSYEFSYDEKRTKEYFKNSLAVWSRQEQSYKNIAKSWKKEELIEVLEEGTLFQVYSRKQFQQIYLDLLAFTHRNLEQELIKENEYSGVPFEFLNLHFRVFWYRERKQVNRLFVDYYDKTVIQREKRFRERTRERINMNLAGVTQEELSELLLNIAPIRPVFIWGAPGIGKSALVEQFAENVGLPCVSLLGSQLAPEDIIGIPRIQGETSEFLPPKMIARKEPYVLFLDELNACSQEVQKAFYSLIYERRVGEYHLPEGSIIIGAGNRAQDGAIVKTMSTALLNRMFHVQLKASPEQWLTWAYQNGIHPWITDYITQRPDQLFMEPPKTEEPYSTPRSWHMLSDILKEYGAGKEDCSLTEEVLRVLVYGCISAKHAGMFLAYTKQLGNTHLLADIIKGEAKWPAKPEERDVLYFLAQSFRARLLHTLPEKKQKLNKESQYLAHRAKMLIKELSQINYEIAQMVVAADEDEMLPDWFMVEIVRDLPRLAVGREN